MNWRSTLQSRTRSPRFLWGMVGFILLVGVATGLAVQNSRPRSLGVEQRESTLSPEEDPEQLAAQRRWAEAWWAIPRALLWRTEARGPVAIAAITGCCWLAFLLQAVQLRGLLDPRLWLALAAVPLGMLSIWPTYFFALWQELTWGLDESASLIHGLRYYILGVGLREETAKLLCLLPLMPLLVWLRSELAALVVSSCVGLGFAVAENAGYFAGSGGFDALGRYLVANPLHLTLTGLVGLGVYRACRNPRAWGSQAFATFGMMVFAHGLYDAFIDVPALRDYSLVGTIVFAGVVYQYFRELRDARERRPDTISLTANFLCGVSLVAACSFVYLSGAVGATAAFDFLFHGILTLAVMVYLFLREMPETLVSV